MEYAILRQIDDASTAVYRYLSNQVLVEKADLIFGSGTKLFP